MAKVNPLVSCPFCGSPYESGARTCPSCYAILNTPPGAFERPNYISKQAYEAGQQTLFSPKPRPADQLFALHKDQTSYYRSCADSDRFFALQDADAVMKNLLFSNTSNDTVKRMIQAGKQIGELAKAIEAYIAAKGELYERRQQKPASVEADSGNDELV